MKIFGLIGWSGSGKTTLLVRLLPELVARGFRVSTVKHTHHDIDVDKPGKDSYRHREAGATEVVLASPHRWTVMHELRGQPEPDMDILIGRMSAVDLVLVEGFKTRSSRFIDHPSASRRFIWVARPWWRWPATRYSRTPPSRCWTWPTR